MKFTQRVTNNFFSYDPKIITINILSKELHSTLLQTKRVVAIYLLLSRFQNYSHVQTLLLYHFFNYLNFSAASKRQLNHSKNNG